MARRSIVAACSLALCLSTLTAPSLAADPIPFPSKIGVLADSQITTDKGTYDYGMRGKIPDYISKVAIRAVAQEYFAPLMLDRMLRELENEKVDLILFLGDGANSGCQDEVETLFKLLAASRERSKIPSYFVIGNHDYLGTGNQVKLEYRGKLCDKGDQSNPALSKEQLIKRLVEHNMNSAKIDSNYAYADKLSDSSSDASAKTCPADDMGHRTLNYVATLSGKTEATRPVQILLADTSDYRDVLFKANFGSLKCERIGGWGLKGSMSFNTADDKTSQIATLAAMADNTTRFRIIASHYSPKKFNAFYPYAISPTLVKDALGALLSNGENIWLTAHTHTEQPKFEKYRVGKRLSGPRGKFVGINVGSTTDYNSHALVVAAKDATNKGNERTTLGYKVISHPIDTQACEKVLASAPEATRNFAPICERESYLSKLGLDKTYRKKCFEEKQRDQVRQNIDKFTRAYAAEHAVDEQEVKACLAYTASAYEMLGRLP